MKIDDLLADLSPQQFSKIVGVNAHGFKNLGHGMYVYERMCESDGMVQHSKIEVQVYAEVDKIKHYIYGANRSTRPKLERTPQPDSWDAVRPISRIIADSEAILKSR
jgi:hypothetical protein